MEITHHGHRISLTDDMQFRVDGPQFDDERHDHGRTFRAFDDAKSEIEKRIATAQKQAVITQRVSIPMLNADGKPITVRGVNRTDSTVLGHEPKDDTLRFCGVPDIFPPVPWIDAALKERADLIRRAADLSHKLRTYGIKASRGYGRTRAEEYDNLHNALIAEIEKKTAAAEAAAPATDAA